MEGDMGRFLSGAVIGLVLGVAGSAVAAKMVGDNGYLMGWEVKVDGEVVCSDPFVWPTIREIECE